MEYIVLIFVIISAIKRLISIITECIDEIIKLRSSLHKLKNHPDCHQSDSDK